MPAYPTTGLAIAGLTVTVTDTTDTDGDGTRNAVDTDDDNDGINDFMADGYVTALDPQRLIPVCGGTPTTTTRVQDGTDGGHFLLYQHIGRAAEHRHYLQQPLHLKPQLRRHEHPLSVLPPGQ